MTGPLRTAPRPVERYWVGPFLVRAWIARGRRAEVWWADSDLGPVALRIPHPELPRPRFDAAVRRSWAASGRRGDLRPEGAIEPLIRGDDLGHLIEGATRNGPVSKEGLAALAHGVLTALGEHPKGHGDLVPPHVLVGEAGTVRLIDADPDGAASAPERPGRASYLDPSSTSVTATDLTALVRALARLWGQGRLPDEHPPSWLGAVASAPEVETALDRLERAVGRLDPVTAAAERARLARRLCPERRRAWALAAEASTRLPPMPRPLEVEPLVEPEASTEPTRVDPKVEEDTYDESRPPGAFGPLEGLLAADAPPIEHGPLSPYEPSPIEHGPLSPYESPPIEHGPLSPYEPPPLELPPEALVPTQVVRRRFPTPPPATPAAWQPPPPVEPEPTALADEEGSRTPEDPRPISSPEAESGMVVPVPEGELAEAKLDRRLTAALVAVVLGLVGLVGALLAQRL